MSGTQARNGTDWNGNGFKHAQSPNQESTLINIITPIKKKNLLESEYYFSFLA